MEYYKRERRPDHTETYGIISLISGIIGLFLFGLPLGIVGFIFGYMGRKHGMGIAGLILSIFNIVYTLIYLSSVG